MVSLFGAAGLEYSVFDAFALPFMSRALIAVIAVSVTAGVVGLFVSFREMEFVTDGLVHAVFPGLVAGFLLGGAAGILPGAAVAALGAAVLFTLTDSRGGSDAGVAVVLTGLFSLGVVLISRGGSYVSQLQELLFGRILTVTSEVLWQIVVVSVVAMAIVLISRRAQLMRAFDPVGAESAGFRPFATDLALNIAVALTVVAGVQALGVLMVIAVLVVPIAVARLLTKRLTLLVPIAMLISLIAGIVGLWLSFDWSVRAGASASPGAMIVLMLITAYVIALVVRGIAPRNARNGRSIA
ncbi:metal ABC transporter permease [Leucobacter sp. 1207-22]|uniref:metal ABC transporter permease n=1 Tax=Leucobacter sp. 1207-22 TaxID=2604456 RepID=UPI0040647F35